MPSIYVFSYFPFGFEGRMWDLIVSVPDHCLSFYFGGLSGRLVFSKRFVDFTRLPYLKKKKKKKKNSGCPAFHTFCLMFVCCSVSFRGLDVEYAAVRISVFEYVPYSDTNFEVVWHSRENVEVQVCSWPVSPSRHLTIGQLVSEIFKFHLKDYDRITDPQNDRTTEWRDDKANPV